MKSIQSSASCYSWQQFIEPLRYATNAEIDEFLESHGYTVDMDDIWFNGQYEISDVKTTNVIVDMEGNFHFIDAVVNNVNFNIDSVNRISINLACHSFI